jgi:hypothetical protein
MWNFVMDKSGAAAGFLRELRFPLPIYIPSASPPSSSLSPKARSGHNANSLTNQIKKKTEQNPTALNYYFLILFVSLKIKDCR